MWRSRGPQLFPKNAPDQKRNDRIGRPATMHARNEKSAVAQGLDSSAFERAGFVFALSFLAAASVGLDLMRAIRALDAERGF